MMPLRLIAAIVIFFQSSVYAVDHVAGQLLVAFKDASSASKRVKIWKKHHVKEIEKVGSTDLYLVEVSDSADLRKVKKAITAEPGVRYAELNAMMHTSGPKNR